MQAVPVLSIIAFPTPYNEAATYIKFRHLPEPKKAIGNEPSVVTIIEIPIGITLLRKCCVSQF